MPHIFHLFMIEGIVGKAVIPGFTVSNSLHLLVTAGLLMVLVLALAGRNRYSQLQRNGRGYYELKLSLTLLILSGGVSTVMVTSFSQTGAFFLVWSLNIFVIFWVIPVVLIKKQYENIYAVIVYLLAGTALASLFFKGYTQGRLGGVFGNPTTMARLLALLYVLVLSHYYSVGRFSFKYHAVGVLALGMLYLTGTRASVFGALLATVVITWIILISRTSFKERSRAFRVFLSLVFLSLGVFTALITSESLLIKTQETLRITQSFDEIYASAREMNWQAALLDLPNYGFFGWGFLSKFGVYQDDLPVGFVLPQYDWTTPHDPLNMILSTAKTQGWVGMFFFVVSLGLMWKLALTSKPGLEKNVAIGILSLGMVWGLADGNWMTTFGDPIDRFSMVILAITLHRISLAKRARINGHSG